MLIISTIQVAFTCSKLAIETLERGVILCSKIIKISERHFILDPENISHLFLVLLLLTLNKYWLRIQMALTTISRFLHGWSISKSASQHLRHYLMVFGRKNRHFVRSANPAFLFVMTCHQIFMVLLATNFNM